MADPITVAVTGKKVFDIGKKVIGNIFGDNKPEWLKYYFSNHWDRFDDRYKNEAFFRWHVVSGTDGNPPYSTTPEFAQEKQQMLGNQGTLADLYLYLFVYGKESSINPNTLAEMKVCIEAGTMKADTSVYNSCWKDNPNQAPITLFFVEDGKIYYKGNGMNGTTATPTDKGADAGIQNNNVALASFVPDGILKNPFVIGGVGLAILTAIIFGIRK